ncbi:MAG: aryl-sulfate sulfotransferase [Ignavibacteriaceae bacterium]|nr:aryl-sulfate sulfotransferase [Ignavibacteriaceae bacterium]
MNYPTLKAKSHFFKLIVYIFLISSRAFTQAFEGYTLFCPNNSRNTYLINMSNQVVHSWTHTKTGGYSCYLLEDGTLLRSAVSSNSQLNGGGAAGIVQKIAWNGSVLWEYTYSSSTYRSHHDICPMPNGNVLLIAWEVKTAAQAVQAGLNHSASIWPDHIVEIQPVGTNGGNIVWQWHAWDHLIQDYNSTKSNFGVVADHPELLDINVGSSGSGDWMHINGISYNPTLDQIVISSHELDEIYVIDHSTTTQEAASHSGGNSGKGGDFLYRWGKPSNYDAPGSQVFNVVHCSVWIPDSLPGGGNILAFNNREGQGSSVVLEIIPPRESNGQYTYSPGTAFGPSSPLWSYTSPSFYSNHLGGCQRLPNGNTLIAESTSGYLFEVDSSGSMVWSFSRGQEVVRALRYAPTYPGLAALLDTNNEIKKDYSFKLEQNYPNPFNPSTTIQYSIPESDFVELKVFNSLGQEVALLVNENKTAGTYTAEFRSTSLPSGVYLYRIKSGNYLETKKMILLR